MATQLVPEKNRECLDACNECAAACEACAQQCIEAAHVVRDAAGRVRGVRPALEGHDLEVGIAPARRARRAHPRGVTADDRQSLLAHDAPERTRPAV